MSEQEFESYLRLLCRFLHLSGKQRDTIARELRAHMEDRLDDLIQRGYTREEAIETALDEFGDAAALAGEFGRIGRRRRWIMRTTGGIIGIAAAVLFVSFLLPENRRHVPAPSYTLAADRGAASVGGSHASSQAVSARMAPESKAEAETRLTLAKIVPEVVFPDGSTIEQVIDFLRQQSKLSCDVNWNALSLVGVDRTATLSLNLHNVKLETALTLALENVGSAGGVQLGYDVIEGIIRVSTVEDLNRKTIITVYDCKDLIPEGLSRGQLQTIQDILTRETGKPLSPLMSDLLTRNLKATAEDDLVDLIKRQIEPGTWEPEGTTGTLTMYDGLLVVRATSPMHHQIVTLLEMIREAKLARRAGASERSEAQALAN